MSTNITAIQRATGALVSLIKQDKVMNIQAPEGVNKTLHFQILLLISEPQVTYRHKK